MPRLIAFAGKAQVGKTTAARALRDEGFRIVSFASGVKEECAQFLETSGVEFDLDNLYGGLKAKDQILEMPALGPAVDAVPEFLAFSNQRLRNNLSERPMRFTGRQLMQWWGTDYRRAQDKDYWASRAVKRVRGLLAEGFDVTLDDARFPDEVMAIQSLGGQVYCVLRPCHIAGTEAAHESETALEGFVGFEGYIPNGGDLKSYIEAVKGLTLKP